MNVSIASNSVQPCHSIIAAEDVVHEQTSLITLRKFLGKMKIEVI